MDIAAVLGVLNDQPSTFTRTGPPYSQFISAVATAKSRYTEGADATTQQVQVFSTLVQDGWLDVWGLLFGVARNQNEGNGPYFTRIVETVLAWVGTLPALQVWTNLFGGGGTVVESGQNSVGYVITIPAAMTPTQIRFFLTSLNRIRPAGVPFILLQAGSGVYLGTIDFLATGSRVQGDYLTEGNAPISPLVAATTPNSQPLLPFLLGVDPSLNPSLAPPS